ncbi:MAG: hypothetical protein RLZZ249_64 [Actinomycetota bacterium]|jgi:hypothetical protein
MCNLFKRVKDNSKDQAPVTSTAIVGQLGFMDEGDIHSGPSGYSPNTAYPETQYGSHFDEDADWHEEN